MAWKTLRTRVLVEYIDWQERFEVWSLRGLRGDKPVHPGRSKPVIVLKVNWDSERFSPSLLPFSLD